MRISRNAMTVNSDRHTLVDMLILQRRPFRPCSNADRFPARWARNLDEFASVTTFLNNLISRCAFPVQLLFFTFWVSPPNSQFGCFHALRSPFFSGAPHNHAFFIPLLLPTCVLPHLPTIRNWSKSFTSPHCIQQPHCHIQLLVISITYRENELGNSANDSDALHICRDRRLAYCRNQDDK